MAINQKTKHWWQYQENLSELANFIQHEKHEELDTAYFLEKPWKWESEWQEYQTDKKINEELDAFDRRDK